MDRLLNLDVRMFVLQSKARRALEGYYFASSVGGALGYLMAHHGESRVVGGGTLLMPQVQRGEAFASYLADVSHISSMKRISQVDRSLVIGGAVTFATLLRNDLVRGGAPLLYEAARQMGTPQVRHLATLAGNIVSAQGNAQGTVALVALDAEVEITNSTGSQWLPIDSLFVRQGVSRVDSTSEIITAFRFHPLATGQGVALGCLAPSNPRARSPLVLALLVSRGEDDKTMDWGSVVMGSTRSVPTHLTAVEKDLYDLSLHDPDPCQSFAEQVGDWAVGEKMLGDAPSTRYEEITPLATRVFRRAIEMARRNRRSAPSSDA